MPGFILEFQQPLPPPTSKIDSWTLSDECNVAANFYNALYHAITVAMLRDYGHEKTYDVHVKLLRHHQKDYFLPGLRKLGLDRDRSDAIRCAKYHCMSNALGGLRTRYAIESDDKAWLFYYPSGSDNPWPAQGIVAHTEGNMTSDYWGWHGNNGSLLGNDGLIYVATHFVANGDPFDGGYFLDTHKPVPAEKKVEVRKGEALPTNLEFKATELHPNEWPQIRLSKAKRGYAISWAADRAWTAVHYLGEPGQATVSYALSTLLFSWLPRLWHAFVDDKGQAPAERLTQFILGLHKASGIEASAETTSTGTSIRFAKSFADYVASGVSEEERRAINVALEESWQRFAWHLDSSLTLSIVSDKHWTVASA